MRHIYYVEQIYQIPNTERTCANYIRDRDKQICQWYFGNKRVCENEDFLYLIKKFLYINIFVYKDKPYSKNIVGTDQYAALVPPAIYRNAAAKPPTSPKRYKYKTLQQPWRLLKVTPVIVSFVFMMHCFLFRLWAFTLRGFWLCTLLGKPSHFVGWPF